MSTTDDGGWLVLCVGARRSGTHLVQRVLASHPEVATLPAETHLFSGGLAPLAQRLHVGVPASPTVGTVHVDPDERRALLREVADRVLRPHLERAPPGTARLLERTPEHVQHIALVAELYPRARFVHVVRDGLAVVTSLVHQRFGPDTVEAAAKEWRDAVQAGRRQGAEVAHYRELRLERLVTDPEATTRELFAWLELRVDDDVVAAAVAEVSVRGNTWGAPTDQGLSRRQRRILDRVAGPVLATLEPMSTPDPRPARPTPHWSATSIHHGQLAVDRLVEAVHTADAAAEEVLADLLAPTARLRVLDGRNETAVPPGTGPRAWLDLLAEDVASWPVAQADVEPSAGLVVAHTSRVHADGRRADRTLVVRLGDDGIRACTQYRHGP